MRFSIHFLAALSAAALALAPVAAQPAEAPKRRGAVADASADALKLVGEWESGKTFEPFYPRVSIGGRVDIWPKPLEARMAKAGTQPVGKPAAGR
ncbi:MAG: hypothetical protein ACXW27_16375 [Allosphingosinicella sp.]